MKGLKLVVLLMLALVAEILSGAPTNECRELPACIQQLRTMAESRRPHEGVGPEVDRLVERIFTYPGAVDALVPLLTNPDEEVANLAAYALRNVPTIDPGYLPQIRAGLDRGLGWLAPALARIGTDQAAEEAVDRYLASRSSPFNQEAYALEFFGRRVIPFIVKRASCRIPCKDDTHYLLGAALGQMGPERAEAGPSLMQIVSGGGGPLEARQGALMMIGKLGSDGLSLEGELLRERKVAPYLSPWIDEALIGIHSPTAGAIFARRLTGEHDANTLRDLAEIGTAGHDAGPRVVNIMKDERELRAAAAMALGYIGYAKAVPTLVSVLDDRVDVNAVWAAATSLGLLHARDQLTALDRIALQHWYPPVRDAARKSAARVRSGAVGSDRRPDGNFAFAMDFYAFESLNHDLPYCKKYHGKSISESPKVKLYAHTSARELQRLKYPAETVSYGAGDEEEQKAAGADVINVNPGNMVEYRKPIEQVPDVALRVIDGWLAGSNRGEWGGELVFVGDDGQLQRIADTNVEDIYRLGTRIVATTGLAHLLLNRGSVVELIRDAEGLWHASTWRILPGAPTASFLVAPQSLLVKMAGGGAVVIDVDGGMHMADCSS